MKSYLKKLDDLLVVEVFEMRLISYQSARGIIKEAEEEIAKLKKELEEKT